MGRIVDLCGDIAASAEEGPAGLILPIEVWDRLRADWQDEDIEDALGLVQDSLLQGELVESADSLNSRLLEVLGGFGEAAAFRGAETDGGRISLDVIGQIARRVARLEEVLDTYRDGASPDRRGFDALQRRLADLGLEAEMESGEREPLVPGDDEDD